MKVVVYTSIFGGYDNLIQDHFELPGVDFLCFTDCEFTSTTWQVRKALPMYTDPNRNAKKYKVLPHRYLSDYDYSIWIDGNIKIVGDVRELLTQKLYQLYDHMQVESYDRRNCIYDEASAILKFGSINSQRYPEKGIKNWKDNPQLITKQMEKYQAAGYPIQNGLATTPIMVRQHNHPDVIKHNEDWWTEIKYHSKRDQLSFDYVAWKNGFKYDFLVGDSRNNSYFKSMGKHIGKK
jgi:hypothetical protein